MRLPWGWTGGAEAGPGPVLPAEGPEQHDNIKQSRIIPGISLIVFSLVALSKPCELSVVTLGYLCEAFKSILFDRSHIKITHN
jgi:hypothetical protein